MLFAPFEMLEEFDADRMRHVWNVLIYLLINDPLNLESKPIETIALW
jgi:hypothetical protein